MQVFFISFIILIFLLFLIGGWVYRRFLDRAHFEQRLSSNYSIDQFKPFALFNYKKLSLSSQSSLWLRKMMSIGSRINNSKIDHIIFVHGTFIGEDPIDLGVLIKQSFPFLRTILKNVPRSVLKLFQKSIFFDTGNFHDRYLELFTQSTALKADVSHFFWSSANHHYARVKAATDLIVHLSNLKTNNVLLIGHSHAGQVFSVLTNILYKDGFLQDICEACKLNFDILLTHKKQIKNNKIDIVTLGSPARYQWKSHKNLRLLHIINHRGIKPIGGSFTGILTTKDGDYIQQLALSGSDSPATVKHYRQFNRNLDKILGLGIDIKLWKKNIFAKKRLHDFGHNLLVDFKDHSSIPNAHKSLFGHGVYTRMSTMLFLFEKVTKHFYDD